MRSLCLFVLFLSVLSYCKSYSFVCSYNKYSNGDKIIKENNFNLTFLIDDETKKTYLIGNNGSDEVVNISENGSQVTFLEKTASGNISITTIDSVLKSAHSRHTVLLGSLVHTQYYGTCEVKR